MKKLRVATVVGTRPEIIRLSRVISKLEQCCEHTLIHTGQNYDFELNDIFFSDLELTKPKFYLAAAASSAIGTISNLLVEVDRAFEKINPEALLVLGDTNSALAALPAKRRKIPVFHMEAGNRCFDQRVPEEINRKIVDHIADINMPYSDIAREYLLREGLPPDRIIKTGSPMFEVIAHCKEKILGSDVLKKMNLERGKYFLVSTHREENVDSPEKLRVIFNTLAKISGRYSLPVLVSTHPRTRKRIEQAGLQVHESITLVKPLGYIDYNALQMSATAVISDSGTISEESNILGFPALNIREAHERPEAMEESGVIMTGISEDRIIQCLSLLIDHDGRKVGRSVQDYVCPDVSEKVVKIIHSYVDYVNRVVWSKRQ
jgi:UDP-N-acetylglucosamine 2-epimerase (non-hydrolysing)